MRRPTRADVALAVAGVAMLVCALVSVRVAEPQLLGVVPLIGVAGVCAAVLLDEHDQ